ncbi:heterokaryon incompatibility, partial [Tothia fuscella]
YLWIDSLCIVQDSTSDWQQESSIMGKVYSSAYCSIAAVGAKNGNEGLFSDRNL